MTMTRTTPKPKHSANGLLARLRSLYDRANHAVEAAALDELPPEVKPVDQREQRSQDHRALPKLQARPPVEPPAGISRAEWREARRNVAAGSAPSTIKEPIRCFRILR
jgi:hypothetical protein